MTRIISGRAGGLRLAVPKTGTRPTSDRVRESLFAALEGQGLVDSAAVLDLYAGSGALGLESLSRGAASVTLVERGRDAAAIASRNAVTVQRALGATGVVTVRQTPVRSMLQQSAALATPPQYDLVFLDPPYDLPTADLTLDLALVSALLGDDGTAVIERSSRSEEPDWAAAALTPCRTKTYGDTVIWWAERV